MKILVAGGAGFVGSAVIRQLIREAGATVVNLDKLTYAATPEALEDCASSPHYRLVTGDICDRALVTSLFEEHQPDAIMHLAAESPVDRSIDGPGDFLQTNIFGTFTVLESARAWRAGRKGEVRFHHISTDYVFDGAKSCAYVETDPVNTANVYGASKRAGEIAALEGNARTVVLRTSWVYSPWSKNFVLTMLRLAREQAHLRIVDDQVGKPTSALDLADACLAISGRLVKIPAESPLWGLYHYAASGSCSWADFAAAIFKQAGRRGGPSPEIERIGTADNPAKAPRPANSALDCSKFETIFGVKTVPWPEALALEMIAERESE